jgi:hypothetical protein
MTYPRKYATATAAGDHLKDLDWDPMVDAANGMIIAGGVTIQYPYNFIVRNVGGVYDAVNGNGVLTYGGSSDAGTVDGNDAAAVIQAAINALTPGRTWKETVVLKGDFGVLSTGITIKKWTVFDARQAYFTSPAAGWAFIIGDQVTETKYVDVFGLKLDGNASADGGVKMSFANYCRLQDCDIGFGDGGAGIGFTKAGAIGLLLDGNSKGDCILNKFDKVRCNYNNIGCEIAGTCNFNTFDFCSFDNNPNIGLFLIWVDYTNPLLDKIPNFNTFRDCDFEANGLGIDDSSNRLNVVDAYFEQNTLDVRCGEYRKCVQPKIQGRAVDRAYNLFSYVYGAVGVDSAMLMSASGELLGLDGYVALGNGATQYTVSFPARYSFETLDKYGYTVTVEPLGWSNGGYLAPVIIYNNKGGTGFQVNFAATPDANRTLYWKVFVKSI